MTIEEYIERYKPCTEALDWCREQGVTTLAEAWDRVPAEYLVWMATRPGVVSDRELRLFASWCVRQVWHLLTDERSRHAVEVAERYAVGAATNEELQSARAAAWYAASAAARAAAWAAMDAAMDLAWAAAWDAALDAAMDAAWAASAARNEQARYLRETIKNPYGP